MVLGNMPEADRLEREQRGLEIKANICRPKEVPFNELNTRRVQTRAIPV